jgi:hypothetical protein
MLSAQLPTVASPMGTVLGALIGATGAILAAVFTTKRTLRTELMRIEAQKQLDRDRLDESREDVISKELSNAI